MDGRQRRRFKGTPLHVKVGYRNNKKTRYLMPDGFLKFRVANVKELELLLMHNKKYAAGVCPGPFLFRGPSPCISQ
jgi:large subunit ribosomal protein L32e